ncbi:hypothetical protein L7F22_041230 [Adiantum nelumboides]|nr:hypothetical protein [Adiantum nelumboides]
MNPLAKAKKISVEGAAELPMEEWSAVGSDILLHGILGKLCIKFLGGVWGSIVSAWREVPATTERNVALPAMKKTLLVMGEFNGLTYATIAGVFAITDASVERIRGKPDLWNGVIGGLAAGSVMGIRARNLRVGLAASGACSAVAAIVEL